MQNVISTSDIPFVTVAFKGVVLLDGCFVFLQLKVIILRPWESHSDKDIVLVWSHWSWSLSSFFLHSLAHYRFQWQYWLVRTVSLLVCVYLFVHLNLVGWLRTAQSCPPHLNHKVTGHRAFLSDAALVKIPNLYSWYIPWWVLRNALPPNSSN